MLVGMRQITLLLSLVGLVAAAAIAQPPDPTHSIACSTAARAPGADTGGGDHGEEEEMPEGMIRVEGELTDEGVECQALRGEDGELYTLTGDLGGFETGDRVWVEGEVAQMSFCMQGTTIVVKEIGRLE